MLGKRRRASPPSPCQVVDRSACRHSKSPIRRFDARARALVLVNPHAILPRAIRRPPKRSVSFHVVRQLADGKGEVVGCVRRWLADHRQALQDVRDEFVAMVTGESDYSAAAADAIEQTFFGGDHQPYSLSSMMRRLHQLPFDELCALYARALPRGPCHLRSEPSRVVRAPSLADPAVAIRAGPCRVRALDAGITTTMPCPATRRASSSFARCCFSWASSSARESSRRRHGAWASAPSATRTARRRASGPTSSLAGACARGPVLGRIGGSARKAAQCANRQLFPGAPDPGARPLARPSHANRCPLAPQALALRTLRRGVDVAAAARKVPGGACAPSRVQRVPSNDC